MVFRNSGDVISWATVLIIFGTFAFSAFSSDSNLSMSAVNKAASLTLSEFSSVFA